MHDQVEFLHDLGMEALSIHGDTKKEDEKAAWDMINKGLLKLLFMSPEKIMKNRTLSLLDKVYEAGRLSHIVIDEAHCCSEWGHDFRPDYRKLGMLKAKFRDIPIMALTATATPVVEDDVKKLLGIPHCFVFRSPTNRKNLFYQVQAKSSKSEDNYKVVSSWLKEHNFVGKCGIIYVTTQKETETVAEGLVNEGLRAAGYHGGMPAASRIKVQNDWMKNRTNIIVATVAFGMGINKLDVRFVVHWELPKSIEAWYQESGRAGRDGLPSRCLLLYRLQDAFRVASIQTNVVDGFSSLFKLCYVLDSPSLCKRIAIANHFGEELNVSTDCAGSCDACASTRNGVEYETTDWTRAGRTAVNWMQERPKEKITMQALVKALRDNSEEPRPSVACAERIVLRLLSESLLRFELKHTSYKTNVYLKVARVSGLDRLRISLEEPKKAKKASKRTGPEESPTKGDNEGALAKRRRKSLTEEEPKAAPKPLLLIENEQVPKRVRLKRVSETGSSSKTPLVLSSPPPSKLKKLGNKAGAGLADWLKTPKVPSGKETPVSEKILIVDSPSVRPLSSSLSSDFEPASPAPSPCPSPPPLDEEAFKPLENSIPEQSFEDVRPSLPPLDEEAFKPLENSFQERSFQEPGNDASRPVSPLWKPKVKASQASQMPPLNSLDPVFPSSQPQASPERNLPVKTAPILGDPVLREKLQQFRDSLDYDASAILPDFALTLISQVPVDADLEDHIRAVLTADAFPILGDDLLGLLQQHQSSN